MITAESAAAITEKNPYGRFFRKIKKTAKKGERSTTVWVDTEEAQVYEVKAYLEKLGYEITIEKQFADYSVVISW